MSMTLGPDEINLLPLPSQLSRSKNVSRRRTVSTSFEQNLKLKNQKLPQNVQSVRKTQSYAQDLAGLPHKGLKKQALYNSFLNKQNEESEPDEKASFLKKIPCLGIILILVGITVYQGGSVVAKKMNIHPFLMVCIRDVIQASFNTPFLIQANQTPFPKGRITLIVIRGMSAGLLMMAHFYAVRYLPMADVMMIASIKPIITTLLSCIFLKEACGVVEILNLLLVISGLFLVVQPSVIFGTTSQQYTSHMSYTALALLVANSLGGAISVILRYLRDMHWAALAITTRMFSIIEMFAVCAFMGLFCIPECGFERWGTLLLAVVGCITQFCFIMALKNEEAHIIGIADNALSIVISFVFQILFFGDYPNLLKIIGTCLVLSSIVIIGGQKIWKKLKNKTKDFVPAE